MAEESGNALQTITFGLIFCIVLAKSDIFKLAAVEVGFHQYAELVDPTTFLKMPFNAAVNIGYVAVGIYWLNKIRKVRIASGAIHYFDMFSMMSIIYGPIQFLRIITQQRLFAILDQWLTLPIFMWASLFGLYCLSQKQHPRSENIILFLSVMSYGFVLFSKVGFEIALGIHIILAVFIGIVCQWKLGTMESFRCLLLAVLCCFGFVMLKINDHELSKQNWIFKRISGHFLSKVCDVMQIDFVARFFLELLQRHSSKTK